MGADATNISDQLIAKWKSEAKAVRISILRSSVACPREGTSIVPWEPG